MRKATKIFSIKIAIGRENPSPHLLNLKKAKGPILETKFEFKKHSPLQDKIKEQTEKLIQFLPRLSKISHKKIDKGLLGLKKITARLPSRSPLLAKKIFSQKTKPKGLFRIVRLFSCLKIRRKKHFLERYWPKLKNSFHFNLGLLVFLILVLMILTPLQIISSYSRAAEAKIKLKQETVSLQKNIPLLQEAITNQELTQIKNTLINFQNNLTGLELGLKKLGPLSWYPPLHSLRSFLRTGRQTAGLMIQIVNETEKMTKGEKNITEGLEAISKNFSEVVENLKIVRRLLDRIDSPLLPPLRGVAQNLIERVEGLCQQSETAAQILNILPQLLADQQPKNYLVLFQNNHELRATGGFVGSFALLEIKNGQIQKWEIPSGGSYDLQGYLTKKLISPQPLWLINPRFEFQDLNWFPDFPVSAGKIAGAFENAGGQTVDGVIALNGSLIENLLEITGGIEMPEYGKTIQGNNFIEATQKAAEFEYDKKENQPKKIIADLFPKMLEKLTSSQTKNYGRLIGLILTALHQKDIQIFSRDENLEKKILEIGWGGALTNTDGDYLMAVSTNIGGGKTDNAIKQEIEKETFVSLDGKIQNQVIIRRTHTGIKGDIFTGKRNISFLRLYVPRGSELIESGGFNPPPTFLFEAPGPDLRPDPEIRQIEQTEKTGPGGTQIFEESGKTVFANWLQLDPGQTEEVHFTYTLPFRLNFSQGPLLYSLVIQKQAGRKDDPFNQIIKIAENKLSGQGEKIISEEKLTLDSDKILAAVIK